MTENKRFELAYEKGNWWAVRDGEITLWKEEVIGLLNEQEEIIQGYIESIGDLQHENEQLKHDATILVQSNADYRKENEQLKQENEFLKEEIRLLKVDLDNIELFEERKVKYSEFWAEKLKKILGD